jgi:hypothetical protein
LRKLRGRLLHFLKRVDARVGGLDSYVNAVNPLDLATHLLWLHKRKKLSASSVMGYFAQNLAVNLLNPSSVSAQQMLVGSALHFCGVSAKVSVLILLFL